MILSNQSSTLKLANRFCLSLFLRGTYIFKVQECFFSKTPCSFNFNEEKRRAIAWEKKMEREARPEPGEEDQKTQYFKLFQSKRKPVSAEVGSFFHNFPKEFKWDWDLIKKMYKQYKIHQIHLDQRYIDQRVDILGYDLAAAHFIVHRGGKIRFKGTSEWVVRNKDEEYTLPSKFSPHYIVEALDASGLPIIYDGLLNIENLYHIKWLSFSRCLNFNDWCIDRICDQGYRRLIYLDISHCPRITEAGLTNLVKLRTLKTINVGGLDHIRNLNLICLLLQDEIPDLNINGLSLDKEETLKPSPIESALN